jgi:uncharacterized protein YgiM (DUF1202 family)
MRLRSGILSKYVYWPAAAIGLVLLLACSRPAAAGTGPVYQVAAARPAAPTPAKTKFAYVNRPSLELRAIPLESSASTGTVKFNDRLEIISTSPKGWTKVRNPHNGNKGWLPTRFLASQIVIAPPHAVHRKHVRRASSVKKKKGVEPPKERVEEQAKPM